MAIDRVGTTRLTVLNPDKRRFADQEPHRSPSANGMEMAHCGYHTLDRAELNEFFGSRDRRGLTPPVRERARIDYGDTVPAVVKY